MSDFVFALAQSTYLTTILHVVAEQELHRALP